MEWKTKLEIKREKRDRYEMLNRSPDSIRQEILDINWCLDVREQELSSGEKKRLLTRLDRLNKIENLSLVFNKKDVRKRIPRTRRYRMDFKLQ